MNLRFLRPRPLLQTHRGIATCIIIVTTTTTTTFKKGLRYGPIDKENQPLVTNEWVEFEKQPVEVQDFQHVIGNVRENWRIYLKSIKNNQKVSTWNHLDLETLGFRPSMPKNHPSPQPPFPLDKMLGSREQNKKKGGTYRSM